VKAPGRDRTLAAIYAAAALSLLYLVLGRLLPPPSSSPAVRAEMRQAAELMARASTAVRDCRAGRGFAIDPAADPNGTGFIGQERTEITTSAGRLEAKRTTTNPDFAALVVSLLREAGVRRGDVVAVGASGSFPALIVATLSAAAAMGVEPLVISSLGASQWGANAPGFDWSGMEDCLRAAGLLGVSPIARAVGGGEDVGRDMDPAGRTGLESRLREGEAPFLAEPDLRRNVARRMALYRERAAGRPIAAFVNIGGSTANIGTNAEVLKLRPGLAAGVFVPPPAERGVLQAMAAEGVPIIHLLNVRGLCERYGLAWDPRPLPEPGGSGLYRRARSASRPPAALTAGYILAVVLLLAFRRRAFFH
jgi:poly-gamma-glutamate system protein